MDVSEHMNRGGTLMSIPLSVSLRPGYCALGSYEKSFSSIASGVLPVGTEMTADDFEKQGIPPSDAPPVLYAYRHMGLVDAYDRLTETAFQLASATGEEKRALLQVLLRRSYAAVFDRIDPLGATSQHLREVFISCGYQPIKMRSKMVTLFLHLCHEAGLIPGLPKSGPYGKKSHATGVEPPHPSSPPLRYRQMILRSGERVILSYEEVDLFTLDEADRTFLLTLIDTFKRYEKQAKGEET